MLTEKETIKKLHDEAAEFRALMKQRQWGQANYRYIRAMNVATFMELSREELDRLFGIRGEKGVIIREGAFPEHLVLKASEMSRAKEIKTAP